jgi:hypothetical protein
MDHGGIFAFARVTPGDGGDSVTPQVAAFEQRLLVGSPPPTVCEQMRHHGRHLADVHHHAGDMLHMIFFGYLLDVLDDIEYDS